MNFVRAAASGLKAAAAPPPAAAARLSSSGPPKRPLSAYFLYLRDARSRGDEPALTGSAQAKALGARWRALGDGERSAYAARAETLKAEYAAAKATWEAAHGPVPKVPRPSKARGAPRKPRRTTAYAVFFKDTKPTLASSLSFGAASKEISAKWAATGPAARAPYEARAAELTKKKLAEYEAAAVAAPS